MLISQSFFRTFFFFSVFLFFSNTIYALYFDRREVTPPSLTYFIFPVVGNIPGVQSFYGFGGSISSIKGSGVDLVAISTYGDANENFDRYGNGEDFRLNIFSVTDIPLAKLFFLDSSFVTLSIFYGGGNNLAVAQRTRGIDSKKDDFTYVLLNSFQFQGVELSYHLFSDQLEIYYTFGAGAVDPLGFILEGGKGSFIKNEDANISSREDGGRYGIYLDGTDNRRDPRIGYRVQYERYNLPSSRREAPAYYQEDYSITGFIPILASKKGVLVLHQFYGASQVTKAGVVNPDNYDCTKLSFKDCKQGDLDNLKQKAQEEVKLSNATSLGGLNRLRGYPSGRFFDSYTNFQGVEFRWYVLEKERAFDIFFERGVHTSWQFAFFYERGTVARTPASLWSKLKSSYGVGVRALFTSSLLRADFGISDEGSELTIFAGYPF